jgi:predicted NBD/HSP70 family sugar kinase
MLSLLTESVKMNFTILACCKQYQKVYTPIQRSEEEAISQQGLSHIDNAGRNRLVILNTIRESGPLSRRELSVASSLSIATTKRLIDELIALGMVAEGLRKDDHPLRGRRASVLALDPGFGFAIGASIEPGAMTLVAIDFEGRALYQKELRPETNDRQSLQALLIDGIQGAIDACGGKGRGSLMGIGIGIAGQVKTREGIILYCPGLPGWENAELGKEVSERFTAPVVIDDGVRCMALAEKRYGGLRDLDNFLYIYVGRGVGAGIVLDNRIYRGKNGICGEFGHITVRENGPLCKCGNQGCLEALVSTRAILERIRQLTGANVYSSLGEGSASGDSLSLAGVYAAAVGGDKLANMVIAETEESIGIGVADLINIFDPGTVILAGEVIESFRDLLIEGVRRIVLRRALHTITQRTSILKSGIETESAARGAATMIIERFLESEMLNL